MKVSSPKISYITCNVPNRKPIRTHRSLCECELYAPSNYDNDPEMKEVMKDFDRQISQRFKEYDERMMKNRQKCKEQCDKDIQKIILKDKIEKELTEKFSTLDTNIDNNDIPTCVCEKSVKDKVEKACLKCGGVLGGGVTPGWGLISGLGYMAWTNYVAGIAAKAATKAGIAKAIEGLGRIYGLNDLTFIKWALKINGTNFDKPNSLISIVKEVSNMCDVIDPDGDVLFCYSQQIINRTPGLFTKTISNQATGVATEAGKVAKTTAATETSKFASQTTTCTTAIIASIVAIVIIVLVMVIIYLIYVIEKKKK
ncbi:PIR protein, putative [Plasmodium sp.]|nr:PIR protein, putative [Plasmodium sp.]